MAASIIWAYETYWSIRALAIFAALGMGLLLANGAFTAMPQRWRIHLARAASASFMVFLFYGVFEEISNHQLKRILFWPFQAISIDGLSAVINWSHISEVRAYRTNWNMTTLSLLLWPVLYFITRNMTHCKTRLVEIIVFLTALAMVMHSQHATAMIAFAVGCAFYYSARANFTWALGLLALTWISVFALVVPISNVLFAYEIHKNGLAPDSFKHRVVLWKYTSDRIAERPLLGVGLGSTHPMNEAVQAKAETVGGTPYRLQTGTHPHNIYLQVWYEIGLIGVICIGSFGLAIIYAISQIAQAIRNFACAAFAVAMTTSLSSFGWYETWYASAIALCCALFFLSTKINRMGCNGQQNNETG
ncbi:MAG: O-antigen ligase domain-containing protein [Muricauda sp. TMED12]|nr:MAG: O-antigen ligase domain-containing protein [Muricauda sp. TMED12]